MVHQGRCHAEAMHEVVHAVDASGEIAAAEPVLRQRARGDGIGAVDGLADEVAGLRLRVQAVLQLGGDINEGEEVDRAAGEPLAGAIHIDRLAGAEVGDSDGGVDTATVDGSPDPVAEREHVAGRRGVARHRGRRRACRTLGSCRSSNPWA